MPDAPRDRLTSLLRLRNRRRGATGLVLSGGGSRADFEIGALTYLYDRVGIEPTVITGTSAGSILGAVLAQHSDAAGQRRALGRLERLWREMADSSEMFTPNEWFVRLRQRGPEWFAALQRQQRQNSLGRTFARVAASGPLPLRLPRAETDDSNGALGVLELLTALREVGRARPDLAVILRGAEREKALYEPGPIVQRLAEPDFFSPARVASSGVTLRIAAVSLESGELHYVTESGGMVDRENRELRGDPVDMVEAVHASCAIPAVFRPVPLRQETYVDGGVRETLPAEIAMTQLGVGRCFAVVASPPGVPRQASYRDKDMLSVVMRSSVGIMTDESLRDEVEWARSAGATVIAPEIEIHDMLTVNPGLTAISLDYGYVRAAEAVDAASAREVALTRELFILRREIWRAEEQLLIRLGLVEPSENDLLESPGGGTTDTPEASPAEASRPAEADSTDAVAGGPASRPGARTEVDPSAQTLTEIAARKRKLRSLLSQVPARRLPPGAQRWWRGYEGHTAEVPLPPIWR